MEIFAITLIAFGVEMLVAVGIYLFGNRILIPGPKPTDDSESDSIYTTHLWTLTSVIYASFFALVFFMLAVAFAVEVYTGLWQNALRYPLVIMPATIFFALTLYFLIRRIVSHAVGMRG